MTDPLPLPLSPTRPPNKVARYAMAAAFLGVGTVHFVAPEGFEAIIPDELPAKRALVYASGVAEVAAGTALAIRPTRRVGWFCTLVLLAIFPANVNQALRDIPIEGLPKPPRWALLARLPMQALMIWAVLAGTRDEARR